MQSKFIYFGPYTTNDLDEMGISPDEAYNFKGVSYEFKLEYSPDMDCIRISDSCNRMIPVDGDNLVELANAVSLAIEMKAEVDAIREAEEAFSEIKDTGIYYCKSLNKVIPL